MIKISPHFSLQELSNTAIDKYLHQNQLEALAQKAKLTALAYYLLEPIRALLNTPLKITSAYRCLGLNDFVGGSMSSQHLMAEAADFVPLNTNIEEAFEKIKKDESIHFGQLILEPSWLHISLGAPFRKLSKCAQVLNNTGRVSCDTGRVSCDTGRVSCDTGEASCDTGRLS